MLSEDLGSALPPGSGNGPWPMTYIPTDDEVIAAVNLTWCLYWNSFSTLDVYGLLVRIRDRNPSWILTEKRLKALRGAALADGRLRQPALEKGVKLRPDAADVRRREEKYVFRREWARAGRACVGELHRKFEVTSGEIVWGQLPAFVQGMKSGARDAAPSAARDVYAAPWRFRAAAKRGVWRVARVNAVPASSDDITGYIVHHTSVSPTAALAEARRIHRHNRAADPLIAYVNRYDWGADGGDPGDALRTVADADSEEWGRAWAARWQMYLEGVQMDKFHPDAARWARLDKFASHAVFFADAANAPEVLKLVSRQSELDTRMKSSSLYPASASNMNPRPFGCHMILPEGEGYEIARMIFSGRKSSIFPEDDELVAFWYDNRHFPYSDEELLGEPEVERV